MIIGIKLIKYGKQELLRPALLLSQKKYYLTEILRTVLPTFII